LHSPLSSPKVRNMRSYTSTTKYIFMVWCLSTRYVFVSWYLVKHRYNSYLCSELCKAAKSVLMMIVLRGMPSNDMLFIPYFIKVRHLVSLMSVSEF